MKKLLAIISIVILSSCGGSSTEATNVDSVSVDTITVKTDSLKVNLDSVSEVGGVSTNVPLK